MTEISRLCVLCGQPMQVQRDWVTGRKLLGCSVYPACRYAEEIPAYFEMLADKRAARLPGLEEG